MKLEFRQPNTPLSINKSNSIHWAVRKRRLDPWRTAVADAVDKFDPEEWKASVGVPADVQVRLWFSTKHRRDPHNYTGTVVKVIIDTLVRKGLWPDDTPEWVTVFDPVILAPYDGHIPHYCVVVIEPS